MEVKNYTVISAIYSDMMSHINYRKWAKYIYEIIKPYLPENPFVLDVTAGSGLLTNHINEIFSNIIMNDISFEMLKVAKLKIPKICSDIRYLPFNTKFDVVISNFDSINYLLTEEDVLKAFKEISQILKPDGIFVFDVSLENNCIQYIKPYIYESKFNNLRYFYKMTYDTKNKINSTIIDIYDHIGQKFSEIHNQKIYPFETIFYLLEQANFEVIRCYECFTKNLATPNSKRAQFITKLIRDEIC